LQGFKDMQESDKIKKEEDTKKSVKKLEEQLNALLELEKISLNAINSQEEQKEFNREIIDKITTTNFEIKKLVQEIQEISEKFVENPRDSVNYCSYTIDEIEKLKGKFREQFKKEQLIEDKRFWLKVIALLIGGAIIGFILTQFYFCPQLDTAIIKLC
jgi:hypothetical protein